MLDTGIFADEGITGTRRKHRKAFNYMIECAKENQFDVIYCKNVQRFARNVEDGSGILKQLKQYGVKVIFEEGNLDSSNTSHELVINMLLSVAQQESQSKSIATKFGINKAQQEGKWTSNRPLGYNRKDGYLCINQEEAKIVQSIYDMYVNRMYGHKKIVDILEDTTPNPSGKHWYQQRIRDVLTNTLYKGVQITHQSENMDVNVNVIRQVPQDEWIVTHNEDIRIIDDDLWQQAQDIYQDKRNAYLKKKVRASSSHTFSTIVYCDNCGGIMRRKRKRTKRNGKMITLDTYEWVCSNNHDKGTKHCKFRNFINEDTLHDYAKDTISNYRQRTDVLDRNLEKYLSTYFSEENIDERLAQIESDILMLKQQRQNRLNLFDKGIVNESELKEYIETEYRPQEKMLFDSQIKYTNIHKEAEKVRRQYRNFIKQLKAINVDKLSNSDMKKVFSGIYVGTYNNVSKNEFIYKTADALEYNFENNDFEKQPYTWKYKDGSFKQVSCQFKFISKHESDIFQHIDGKEWEGERF